MFPFFVFLKLFMDGSTHSHLKSFVGWVFCNTLTMTTKTELCSCMDVSDTLHFSKKSPTHCTYIYTVNKRKHLTVIKPVLDYIMLSNLHKMSMNDGIIEGNQKKRCNEHSINLIPEIYWLLQGYCLLWINIAQQCLQKGKHLLIIVNSTKK